MGSECLVAAGAVPPVVPGSKHISQWVTSALLSVGAYWASQRYFGSQHIGLLMTKRLMLKFDAKTSTVFWGIRLLMATSGIEHSNQTAQGHQFKCSINKTQPNETYAG